MSQLTTALEKCRDDKLTLAGLEKLHDELTHLYTMVCLEYAEKRKAEALYFLKQKDASPDASDVSIKRMFRGTPDGQRLLELQAYRSAIPRELESIKSRIFSELRK